MPVRITAFLAISTPALSACQLTSRTDCSASVENYILLGFLRLPLFFLVLSTHLLFICSALYVFHFRFHASLILKIASGSAGWVISVAFLGSFRHSQLKLLNASCTAGVTLCLEQLPSNKFSLLSKTSFLLTCGPDSHWTRVLLSIRSFCWVWQQTLRTSSRTFRMEYERWTF